MSSASSRLLPRRHLAIFCFLWIFGLAPLINAQQLRREALVINVGYETLIKSEKQWQTGWGEFSKDYVNARVLDVVLKVLGPFDPRVKIEWFFIGQDYDAKKLFIYDRGETEGTVRPGGIHVLPYSRDLIANREKSAFAKNGNQLSGRWPWGWALFVSQNGKRVGDAASLHELVDWTDKHREEAPPADKKRSGLPFVPIFAGTKPK